MKVLMRILFIVLMFACQNLHAVEVKRLYEVEVISKSKRLQDKNAAIRQGLKIVLTRVLSGNDVWHEPVVKNVLINATRYVNEFQYSMRRASISENNSSRIMRILFDEKLLVKTLRVSSGLWNEIRPRTLIWLVVEDKGKQSFFDVGMMPELNLALKNASREKGLPMLYPIQDLDEGMTLSIDNVLSAYSRRLLVVSSRYDVVSTLAGRIVNKGDCWQAEWTHYFDAKISQWRSPCGSLTDVTLKGFQGIYDKLSNYYAAKPSR